VGGLSFLFLYQLFLIFLQAYQPADYYLFEIGGPPAEKTAFLVAVMVGS